MSEQPIKVKINFNIGCIKFYSKWLRQLGKSNASRTAENDNLWTKFTKFTNVWSLNGATLRQDSTLTKDNMELIGTAESCVNNIKSWPPRVEVLYHAGIIVCGISSVTTTVKVVPHKKLLLQRIIWYESHLLKSKKDILIVQVIMAKPGIGSQTACSQSAIWC